MLGVIMTISPRDLGDLYLDKFSYFKKPHWYQLRVTRAA